uniref:DUF4708 domain-containing protein n=1 Tax=Periophthalmus magnuspinnatus TaxID=409849 RepID=A0A3B4AAZ4_9GOBI
RMSGVQPGLFFLSLPNLKSLCCVTLTLQDNYEEPRTKQITKCRSLRSLTLSFTSSAPSLPVLLFISPDFCLFFQMNFAEQVYPGILQSCFSFSLISRLSPNWNKAGLYLVNGELEDFGLSPLVLKRFCSDPDSVLDPHHMGGPIWCHVLPSMKKGQIISISRKLPKDGPFKSYRALQSHWNSLYGYRLPEQQENQAVYCSVYFKLVGQNLFTYPLCCIRLSPVHRCPRVDHEGALSCFMTDVRETLPAICGFPTKISTKSSFTTTTLNPASRQLPPPPPTLPRLTRPVFGSQPAPAPPLSFTSDSFSFQRSSSNPTLNFSDVFKPASSVNTFFTVFEANSSSPSSPRLFQQEKTKFVPIFRSKPPSQLVNVALLKAKKQNIERLLHTSTPNAENSKHIPMFVPKISSGVKKSFNVKRIRTFSPKKQMKPALIVTPEGKAGKEKKKSKAAVKFNLEEIEKTAPKCNRKVTDPEHLNLTNL